MSTTRPGQATAPDPGQFNTDRTYPGQWIITFSNPPINMFVPTTIVELGALMTGLEADPSVKVVVFQSSNPDFFIAHLDVSKAAEQPEVLGLWRDFVLRLSSMPVVSIAKIRGRTRGIGNEFVLACDMRFASRQSALSATPRSASDWFRAAELWSGSRVWSAARGHLRLCLVATTSMLTSPSDMAG
jgi:enoyl-CoA hydratase/carnithine racemase